MSSITSFARACRSYFAGVSQAPLHVALTEKSDAQMVRCGETSAAILHRKLSGLYYA